MDDDPGRATDSMFFCRLATGFGLEILAEIFLITSVARLYSIYGNLLTDSDSECALKAGFSMFIIVLLLQLAVIIFDLIFILAIVYTKAPCKCSCYSLKMITHFLSVLGILLGTMIYGIKDPDKVGWGFWVAFAAGGFCFFNAMMLVFTEQIRKSLQKSGVDLNVLDRGGRIE